MIPLRKECQEAYWRSEIINDRGIRVDTVSAVAALELVAKAKAALDAEMLDLTDGAATCSQVEALKDWILGQGIEVPSLAKAEIEDLLEQEDLPPAVRRAVELRQEYAKTSVAKLEAFLKRVGRDGRIRGSFLFRAAGTGRYSSTGAQLHNLPRPRKAFGDAHLDPANLFGAIRTGDPGWLRTLYGDELGRPLWLVSDAIRGFLWAGPGRDLLAADYSGIEGAVAAWLADERWKVVALFDLIADPSLPDMYRRAAAGIFNTTTDLLGKKDGRRQVGKVSELALQYQGGIGAFRSMARKYSLKIRPVFEPVWEAADAERRERAVSRYEECCARNELLTQQLVREEWLAAELVKVGWRATHPAICAMWKALESGVREAVDYPGRVVAVGRCSYVVKAGFLWCKLPSGRCLAYGKPQVREQVVPWADPNVVEEQQEKRPVVTVLGVDSVTKKWVRYALYGGLLFENNVQAIALDLLENGIERAEAAGYPVIGHVHDEIITEVPRGWGDLRAFCQDICVLPEWAAGLPLTADGWRGKRYRKD
ncbi:MAG: hypothetical protein WAP03_27930 [Methylorubrum rhodinum]|uniref:hypothetical protein n=1 Tax=Methylorubrum rhodinum TaxID=29428 RepID=UPI003BB1933E